VSPTPERLRYLAQLAGGGVLRELERGIDLAGKMQRGDEVKTSAIPVASRFYGQVDADNVERSRYFDARTKLQTLTSSLKAAQKAGDGEAMLRMMKDHPELAMASAGDRLARSLSEMNRLAVTAGNDREMLKQMDASRIQVMKTLNTTLRQMEQATDGPTVAQRLAGARKREEAVATP
jgi:hypothetical protein